MRAFWNPLLLALAIGAGSASAIAQVGNVHRVALLSYGCPLESERPNWVGKFREYLAELGYVEGRNLIFDLRIASAASDRLPLLATELLALKPDVLVADFHEVTKAVKSLTTTVPILFSGTGDPVAAGFVASLARPGGNMTGMAYTAADLKGKQLELLRKVAPRAKRLAVLSQTENLQYVERRLRAPAAAVGFTVVPVVVDSEGDLAAALASIRAAKADALMTTGGALFVCKRRQIADLAREAGIPSAFDLRDHVEAGGLLSYGPNVLAITRLGARFVDRVLRGGKPAEMPVEQPNEYELVVNLGVARALGIAIPDEIMVVAQKVIE